jgi:hypothetical protein
MDPEYVHIYVRYPDSSEDDEFNFKCGHSASQLQIREGYSLDDYEIRKVASDKQSVLGLGSGFTFKDLGMCDGSAPYEFIVYVSLKRFGLK